MPATITATPAELHDATKRFGSVMALDRVSLALEPGKLTSVLGPNGAGKTTAIKLLLGLSQPTDGTARLFGVDPRSRAARERTGALLQVGKVPETLKVREHIELFSSYYPSPMPFADLCQIAGLRGIEERRYGELPGGQQRRVLFALALCGDPQLLFLDEPTVGLDVESRRTLWAQIRRLLERGRSILLTTHYLEEADALADRIVVLGQGRILADGSPSDIKRRVAGQRVRCSTQISVDELRALPGVRLAQVEGGLVEMFTDAAEPLVRHLLTHDPELSRLEVGSVNLEEAFLALTANPAPGAETPAVHPNERANSGKFTTAPRPWSWRSHCGPTSCWQTSAGGRAVDPDLALEAWSEPDPLTERERAVLRLAGDGGSGSDIAETLGLSEGTVRNYLSEAMNKLGAKNRVEAARIARMKGWL